MSKDRPSIRGRGDEILGRGVDALFSSPAPRPAETDAAATTSADLEQLLASEALSATTGAGSGADVPPSPIRTTGPAASAVAGGGVTIPDDELLSSIDIPLARNEEAVIEPPIDQLAIDVPSPGDSSPGPAPSPFDAMAPQVVISPPISPEPSFPPIAPQPVTPQASPTLRPSAPSPFGAAQPSVLPTTPPTTTARPSTGARPSAPSSQAGAPPFSVLPAGPTTQAPTPRPSTSSGSRPALPSAVAPAAPGSADAGLPPERPRVTIGGVLTEVPVAPGELDPASVRPQSPFDPRPVQVIEEPPVQPPRTADEVGRLLSRVDEKRIDTLNREIDRLYRDIPDRISNRPDLSGQAMGLLRRARTTLFENPEDFVEAEYLVKQATLIYNRIENSEKWGDKYGWRVFWYEIIVLAIFLISFMLILAFSEPFSDFLKRLVSGGATEDIPGIFAAVGFWATFVWGGIGGVVGALYILWTHISERQDFERQHVMWYIVQPILGLILGGVTFLIIYTGLLSLQGSGTTVAALTGQVQLFPCLVAFVAGFRPQFIFGLLTKIIKIINPTEGERTT